MMVPKTRRHRMLYCCRNRMLFTSHVRIFMLFPFLPWIWNYILSLPVQLRHESCLFFESLIWSLCNERHGTWILARFPHSSDLMFTRAHTNPFLLVCTSGFLWMAHIHLHISSLFGILPTYIHLCEMLLWVLNESNFKREVISETQHIRMIPLHLQLHRHVYFLIFFFSFQRCQFQREVRFVTV